MKALHCGERDLQWHENYQAVGNQGQMSQGAVVSYRIYQTYVHIFMSMSGGHLFCLKFIHSCQEVVSLYIVPNVADY